MWDLGRQPRFRDSWEKYCRTSSAIAFVIDSADSGNFNVAKINFNKLFNGIVEGVPILVLGNKNDLPNALNENGIIQAMELSNIKDRIVACYSIS